MTELDKLYEKFKIKKTELSYPDNIEPFYPDLTSEQILKLEEVVFKENFGSCELYRSLGTEFDKNHRFKRHYFIWCYEASFIGYYDEKTGETFDEWHAESKNSDRVEALAGFINSLLKESWQFSDNGKKKIKEILKG